MHNWLKLKTKDLGHAISDIKILDKGGIVNTLRTSNYFLVSYVFCILYCLNIVIGFIFSKLFGQHRRGGSKPVLF